MRRIGFSTGAIARGDFRKALAMLQQHAVDVVELSALRVEELAPLVTAFPSVQIEHFSFVSVHAPSRFPRESEQQVIEQLVSLAARGCPIVVHPDVIADPDKWKVLGDKLLIENMDKRKPVGRSVQELNGIFQMLPAAGFCFDVGHARQWDPTMTEAALLLRAFGDRLAEVHMSEVNTASRHDPISRYAVLAFRAITASIPESIPIILEPLIDQGQSNIETELQRARDAFDHPKPANCSNSSSTKNNWHQA